MPSFYEFFAGAGMARAGLGSKWTCLFANDFDLKKSETYRLNWQDKELKTADVSTLKTSDIPGKADLIWASFPCQDLSLAGGGAGLKGERSGTFWPFWHLVKALIKDKKEPKIIVLENVCGTLSSHEGKDFAAICKAFLEANYKCGALVIDASYFVPQSRPRLFIIGVHHSISVSDSLISPSFNAWHTRGLKLAWKKLPPALQNNWIWWNLPIPSKRTKQFSDLIEENPCGVTWHSKEETKILLEMMSKINLEKVKNAQILGKKLVGAVYKRTRIEAGKKVQRAEVRFDGIAGCLRTPAGGSSRQLVLLVEGKNIRSRLISTRETARLMGLQDSYKLPQNYNEGYHLTGDGVVVPVVRHLAEFLIEPILKQSGTARKAA